ncbi:MAG: cytochrome c [Gammaproteobacteria bacterium]|nr:cytochrome c [Gammaproteobacteria bacterium]
MRTLLLGGLLLSAPALAGENTVSLKDAPGRDLVVRRCIACHSLDYIPMNSVFLDRKAWQAEVNKMTNVMGAPIAEEDAVKIVDYLVSEYGK